MCAFGTNRLVGKSQALAPVAHLLSLICWHSSAAAHLLLEIQRQPVSSDFERKKIIGNTAAESRL